MVYTDEKKRILGENIWMRREVASMSRDELARKMHVTRETLGKWENGYIVPSKENLFRLTKIFDCSKHDLHRPYTIPVIKLIDEPKKVESKWEDRFAPEYELQMVDDEPIIAIKSDEPVLEEPKNAGSHPVTVRLNKYLEENKMTQHGFAKISGVSSGDVWRVKNGAVKNPNGPAYKKVEAYLDKVEGLEKSGGVKVGSGPEPYKCKEQPVQEEPVESAKPVEKGSLTDRLDILYETLFNTLAELDELRADISKIEKVTAMLKEIQGL